MSDRSDRATREESAGAEGRAVPWRVAVAALLAFMIAGVIGSVSRMGPALGSTADVLFVNGRSYGILLVTLLMVVVGYGVGQSLGSDR